MPLRLISSQEDSYEPPGVLARVLPPLLVFRCCVLFAGPFLVLPRREQLASYTAGSTICSSPAAQTMAPSVVSPPLPRRLEGQRFWMSRPWCEVKNRRGAPKRVKTEGFACPHQQCAYCGITDAHIHALVGDGTHGRADRFGPAIYVFAVGLVLVGVGPILAAIAIWRSETLSRWSGLPFALGFALYIPQFFGSQPIRIAHGLLVTLGCLWVAWSMGRSRS
jgi:hypothetical protein